MRYDLDSVCATLATLTKAEIRALLTAAEGSPELAPLFAYLMHACKWELRRRKRQPSRLKTPREAIPAEAPRRIETMRRATSDGDCCEQSGVEPLPDDEARELARKLRAMLLPAFKAEFRFH